MRTHTITNNPAGLDALERLEELALTVAVQTGGLSMHAAEGGWCVHVGPHNRFLGCTQPTIVDAIVHAAVDHMDPTSGAPVGVDRMHSDNAGQSNEHEGEQ